AGVPAEDELRAAFQRAAAADIAAYQDDAPSGALVDQPPAPGRITAERDIASIGATEWRLSNGARVIIKPTDFQDDEVLFGAISPGGISQFADSVIVDARLATLTVQNSGLADMSLVQLQKALAGKLVSVAPGISELSESISGQAAASDVETLLQLVHLYFTAP